MHAHALEWLADQLRELVREELILFSGQDHNQIGLLRLRPARAQTPHQGEPTYSSCHRRAQSKPSPVTHRCESATALSKWLFSSLLASGATHDPLLVCRTEKHHR